MDKRGICYLEQQKQEVLEGHDHTCPKRTQYRKEVIFNII